MWEYGDLGGRFQERIPRVGNVLDKSYKMNFIWSEKDR